jgi:cytidyltransferase-like protein
LHYGHLDLIERAAVLYDDLVVGVYDHSRPTKSVLFSIDERLAMIEEALDGAAVQEKFGGVNHQVYERMFELILRLKGNYLWPAMWGNAFNDDDKLNPVLADEYGIVMGTSHHEPMLRAQQEWRRYGKGEWNYVTNDTTLVSYVTATPDTSAATGAMAPGGALALPPFPRSTRGRSARPPSPMHRSGSILCPHKGR